MDRVNGWLEKAWRKGLTYRPSLDPDDLWSKALRDAPAAGEQSPRSEADCADFRLRLEILCESLVSEAALNPLGLTMAHGQLVRAIRQRLELGALWQAEPELLETPLAPPVIVVGHMRSGTTRVHRLLAADPSLSATRFCDSWQPVPRSPDTRPAWSAFTLLLARALDPWIDTIHPFGVTRADEELGWLAAALDHSAYEAQWHIPSFTAFSETRDPTPLYREFTRMLRTDANWHGNAHRPRVLKVPQFSEDLPALLGQFPGARVVRTQRCANDTAASAASLVANQMAMQSDTVDYSWIEAEVARKIALREERMDRALAAFSGPLTTVDFDALNHDWEAEVRRVYEDLSLPLTTEALQAMRGEQGRAQHSPHTAHSRQMHRFSETTA
ncbi:sulfotransferase [Erythrobacter westpacificensis]|uniref:sulfotransferase family protein n=1 Tax=Erythrobacter westpacificensis TaxID=1055231 RepID=UPI0031F7AE42